ncbi:MAG: AsmA family protein, partial [Alphaproteobacteria bacterium HGW-Alphaproteobacteria-2]
MESASITGGLIRYVDHAGGQETVLSDADLTLGLPGLAGRATLEGSARFNGAPVMLSVMLDGVEQMLAGTVRPVEFRLETGGNTVAFTGRAGADPVAAEGRLEADLRDLASLLALAGQPPVDLPKGLGRERIALSGDMTLAGAERVFLRGGTLRLDSNTIRADVDVSLAGARPRLVAQLVADTFDLSGLAGGGGDTAGGGSAGWPKEAIDVSGLSAADAEVALSAQAVRFGDFALGATDI